MEEKLALKQNLTCASLSLSHQHAGSHYSTERGRNLSMVGERNASLAGDIDELRRLFQEGSLLQQSPRQPANNPLHIAAAHGHAEFVREILAHKPKFATGFSSRGLTALHLACADVHLMVVKELVRSNIGTEVCNVRHKDGLLPVQTSALTRSIPVMEELVGACLENVVQELTCLTDSIHSTLSTN